MRSFTELKKNYNFTKEDENRLSNLAPLMTNKADRIVNNIHEWIIQTDTAFKLFKNETMMNHIMN